MQLKPSTIFQRWIKANSTRIMAEDEHFQHLVGTTSFMLTMIEDNPNGLPGMTIEYAIDLNERFLAAVAKRGMTPPDIQLPKMKVIPKVRPS